MNRNTKGEVFSRSELIAMAIECGAIKAHEITREMKTWEFKTMTRAHRFALFARGEAILDTRPVERKPMAAPTVDRELLAFLGVTV